MLDYSEVERFLIRRGSDLPQAKSRALACFDELSVDVGQRPFPFPLPSCRDPDDQFLIDLAVGAGAEFLITKDRHLLSMSASFRRAGFATRITTPENMPSFAATAGGISCE